MFSITHIYREANTCVDFFANLGGNLLSLTYFDPSILPQILKGFVNLDKCGLPYIRFMFPFLYVVFQLYNFMV